MGKSINTKEYGHAFGITVSAAALLSFLQFILYYVPFGYFYDYDSVLIASTYLSSAIEFLLPVGCAVVVYLVYPLGTRNKVLPSFIMAAARLLYSVPYYYIYYVSDVFDSSEAILLALLVSILFVFYCALQTFICIFVISFVAKRKIANSDTNESARIFNLDDQLNFGILISVFFIFTVFFIREIITTVEYLIESAPSYRTDEILLLIISYLLIIVFAFITYVIATSIKNRMKKYASKEEKE